MDDTTMQTSILISVRLFIGIGKDCAVYDDQIVPLINTAFAYSNSLGAGPENGFAIEDVTQVWTEFCTDSPLLGFIKSFVKQKTKLIFDPPTSSVLIEAIQQSLDELEFSIKVRAEKIAL